MGLVVFFFLHFFLCGCTFCSPPSSSNKKTHIHMNHDNERFALSLLPCIISTWKGHYKYGCLTMLAALLSNYRQEFRGSNVWSPAVDRAILHSANAITFYLTVNHVRDIVFGCVAVPAWWVWLTTVWELSDTSHSEEFRFQIYTYLHWLQCVQQTVVALALKSKKK